MKQLLLLAALAAPFIMGAQATTTPPAEGTSVLDYAMPKGTLYYPGGEAYLPPVTPLTFVNTSYYAGGTSMLAEPDTDPGFSWTLSINATDTTIEARNLTTPVAYTLPPLYFGPATDLPSLESPFAETPYKAPYTAHITTADTSTPLFIFDPSKLTPTYSELYAFNSEYADQSWGAINTDLDRVKLTGIAQLIEYPGAPYQLYSAGVPVLADDNSTLVTDCTFSIYPANADGTMGSEPIFSGTPTNSPLNNQPVVSTLDSIGNPLYITGPVYFVISDYTGPSMVIARSAVAVPDATKPAPKVEGIYGIVEGLDSLGNTVKRFEQWTEYLGPDGFDDAVKDPATGQTATQALVVCLDLTISAYYPYLIPDRDEAFPDSTLAPGTLDINFGDYSYAEYRVRTSDMNPTFTQPDGSPLPDWLTVEVKAPTAAQQVDVLMNEMGLRGGWSNFRPRFTFVAFTMHSDGTGPVDVVAHLSGGVTVPFATVTTSTTGAITAPTESAAEIVGHEYYDLAGRRLQSAPQSGFFIEKAIRADGTSTSLSRIAR